ncbi:MAG: peroxide stress protein YaaA [Bacteroidales bacterium]|nr:peroxide stress protein YaaA [Bacteroidales bacterium]
MLILLSPAKTLNENFDYSSDLYSLPDFLSESEILVNKLKTFSAKKLTGLMNINPKLAELNAGRFAHWSLPFEPGIAKPALLMFNGEVYNGLKASSLSEMDLQYAQNHLRILSGLYGILRPLDIIKAYRLEMGTKLKPGRKKDLYHFWGDKITDKINEELSSHNSRVLLNLASAEYFKAVKTDRVKARIISCNFKEEVNGQYKFVTVFGKKARGLMARFIIQNRIDNAEDIKHFEEEGYFYNDRLSSENEWLFTR